MRENRWEWSDEVAQMHGYEPGTVQPTTELVLSHKHPDDKPTVAELIEQVRRHGVPFSSRHRIIDTAGDIHLVVVVGDRLYGPDGQVDGTSGFYVDITEEFDTDLQQSVNEVVATIDENRAVINQAIGIMMLTHGVTAERASDVLAWRSKQTNVKLRTIAARFVAAVAASELLSGDERNRVDHLLLTAHEESAAG
ncbi:PAS and ANTAR domain-containing protein [Mycobacterium sp.]|uniref:PAS and ANTAR domain-containing protein n=1 Tax=Mycobacterium sp. TaxID=1785 RepID=UPI002C09A76E|nr:PAS and ANTAR domain-containing protein [Mycobacterium sp.]HME47340.1 PAS and ANTAR domain-containing protein [Mycobacterium sp.]